MKLPAGVERVEGPNAWGFAAPEARAWVSHVLARGATLSAAAAAQPDVIELKGRGPVHAVPEPGGGRWVVRPYRRGGAVAAPLLGDRHLRLGRPRPVAEALASAEVEARGLPTPRVLAGAIYPRGAFYRADIVTRYIPAARDLAAALFGGEAGRSDPWPLLEAAARLIGRAARAGIEHRDLNARNILLAGEGEAPVAMLLDLDRCRVSPRGVEVTPWKMLRRLERSLRKIARARGRTLAAADLARLREAVLSR